MRKQIQVDSTVVVRLYDDREVEATITRIVGSVAGAKGSNRIRPHSLEDPETLSAFSQHKKVLDSMIWTP
jgi:hypothetical protein